MSSFPRRARSTVWTYFERGSEKHKCKLCQKTYTRQSGTSNLFAHLKVSHPKEFALTQSGPTSSSSGNSTSASATDAGSLRSFFVSSATTKSRPCSSARAGEVTELILDWVIDSCRPLSTISDPGFVRLLGFTEPDFTVPSRTHLTSLMKKRHADGKSELKELLKDATGLALTTDGWTSSSTHSYLTYTAHFIDKDWTLNGVVLQTAVFQGGHTAVRLAQHFTGVLDGYDIPWHLVVAVTHDEAANMVAAANRLEDDVGCKSQVCMAHRLQTVIRHAVDKTNGVDKVLSAARKLVGHFKHSALASDALYQKQLQLEPSVRPKRVVQDVPTRWNSSFYMLERLLEIRTALTVLLTDVLATPKREYRDLLLKDNQWSAAEHLVAILRPFELATTVGSGQQYTTISIMLPIVTKLNAGVKRLAQSADSVMARSFASTLQVGLEKKFSLTHFATSSIPVVTCALDPRFRNLPFLEPEERDVVRKNLLLMSVKDRSVPAPSSRSIETPAKKSCSLAQLLSSDVPSDDDSSDDEDSGSQASKLEEQVERQLAVYFTEEAVPFDTNPLEWWKLHASRFPDVSALARKFLAVPGTSVPSEAVFSSAGVLVSKLRSSLHPDNVDALIFLRKNVMLKSARHTLSPCPLPDDAVADRRDVAEEEVLTARLPPLPQL